MASKPDLREYFERIRRNTFSAARGSADRSVRLMRAVGHLPQTKRIAHAGAVARDYVSDKFADAHQYSRNALSRGFSAAWSALAPWRRTAMNALRLLLMRAASICAPAWRAFAAQPWAAPTVQALPLVRWCVTIAGANLLQFRLRLVAALSGVAVALFLLILQISVLNAASAKVTALYDDFNFDMVIVPDTYQFLLSFDTVNRIVLNIAQATGDVADTYGLNVGVAHWTELPSNDTTYNFIIGIDQPGKFVNDPDIRDGWAKLNTPHAILADHYSEEAVGPVSVGTDAEINGQRVTVAGQFKLGLFFYAEGAAIVRNINFAHLVGRDSQSISIGLLRLNPGISPKKAKADLIKALPSDTLVLTRTELLDGERDYFLSTKPIGIMIHISMIIACLVAIAIIIQVLSTDMANRMNEYAVFKAMGAPPPFVYGVGLAQAGLLGLGGLVPAALLGVLVLGFIQYRTHLATALGPWLIAEMILITLALAGGACAAIIRRVQRADPAELY